MDAPRALVFRPLVKGNEALGTRLSDGRSGYGSVVGYELGTSKVVSKESCEIAVTLKLTENAVECSRTVGHVARSSISLNVRFAQLFFR